MHRSTIEFSRSINKEIADEAINKHFNNLPKGSFGYSNYRNPIWHAPFDDFHGPQHKRMKLTAVEKTIRLNVEVNNNPRHADLKLSTKYETLSPRFSEKYSISKKRWANVLIPSTFLDFNIATVLPHNTFDRKWPRLNFGTDYVGITQEGWVFNQDHKNWEDYIYLPENDEAIISWLKTQNIDAKLSEPGRIAKQVLNSLEGFWGLHLLSDPETLQLINKQANRVRRRVSKNEPEPLEEEFSGRTVSTIIWNNILRKRLEKGLLPNLTLADYTNRNILRLGLEIVCNYCDNKNWHGLDESDYEIVCERCLKSYDFPQADLRPNNRNWKYRVVGPFAIPDYARGSYATLLTIDKLRNVKSMHGAYTFSTALNITSNDKNCEIDFALWCGDESMHDTYKSPKLIIGEAKSFGTEVIKKKDITQLKIASSMLPESIIVISVLKNDFSLNEKKLLANFVNWTRKSKKYEPRHWVILLTGTELFDDYKIGHDWKDMGEPFNKFTDHRYTSSFRALSDATIEIYLGLPSYYEWRDKNRNL